MHTRTEPNPSAAVQDAAGRSVVIAIAGSGGDGVALIGDLLLKMAAHQGLYGMLVQSYGPQIRGGESAVVLRIGERETLYEGDDTDLLVCFKAADLKRFKGSLRLHEDSLLILEERDTGELPDWLGATRRPAYRHPFATYDGEVEIAGEPKNMKALALVCRAMGWADSLAEQALKERFADRPALVERNMPTFRKVFARDDVPALPRVTGHGVPLVVETGNEASARGAIAAGLRFFAGYPITPSSEVMETLIDELPAAGGRLLQAEDEISALGMVVGASFGGVPSMTATSGPGLSLMTEMMGLSSMAEIPTIIVDCQRAGPATGMPSRTEQSDLFHAVYGGHGDFPRAVLGVFDVVHARDVMHRSFQLAEDYQLPVLVLSDAYVAQRRQIRDAVVNRKDRPERRHWKSAQDGMTRFSLTNDQPVNAFRVPGTPGGTYMAAGIEHTEEGNPTADAGMHQRMSARRFRKMEGIAMDTRDWVRTLGAERAPKGLVAWGSTYGMLTEWVREHPEYRVFLPEILHPFPLEAFTAWRRGLRECSVVELSFQGQFHRYLTSLTDMTGVRSLARSGGLPMSKRELAALLGAAGKEK
jgi:2-oxoglutarate ferredoxin oxidoreductase subunit alpha